MIYYNENAPTLTLVQKDVKPDQIRLQEVLSRLVEKCECEGGNPERIIYDRFPEIQSLPRREDLISFLMEMDQMKNLQQLINGGRILKANAEYRSIFHSWSLFTYLCAISDL